ncbi:SDR family NAD(P)-dependent oxidoreductase [Pseudomonas saponiphila]|uniref:SDR family NAD(P)-dependent oxidoreductase n=1 Tax=Pseudomonas saponiphila TaxID=556534 RepID=UPI0022405235|nr:SDR family oxidoreductase [Pseudomonas saponiphila]
MNSNPTIDNGLRVALVTGSTSGIGAAIARALSQAGYAVVLHSRTSADTGRAMAAEMKQAVYVQADLAVEADRARLVNEAIAAWGQLDVLINNAGISRVIPHGDLASANSMVWHELNEVNVVAPFHLVTLAESALRAALNHMTRLLALSLGPDIRVNAVAPGLVDTPMTAEWADAQEVWRTRAPMRRAASPGDVAHAVVMLVESDYLTGEILLSDGGLNLT